MKLSMIGKALFVGLAMAIGAATGCSSKSTPLGGPSGTASPGEDTGSVGLELRLGRTTHINKVNYTLTGPNGFSRSGFVDVSQLREVEGVIANVPAGGPYTLSVNATSTNGNVTCTGSKMGITITCPGSTEAEDKNVKMTCTRGHVGHEWGDDDWRENARTFFVGTEFNLLCAGQDAGAPDTGAPDTGKPDGCFPVTSCPMGQNCGTAPDGCGGTLSCGTCVAPQTCGGGNTGTPGQCGCTKLTSCPAPDNCGTIPDGCGTGTVNCGPACAAPFICGAVTPNFCECPRQTTCPSGQICGTASDNCGDIISCGPACPVGTACNATQTACTTSPSPCPGACPNGANCGTFDPGIEGCPVLQCGTCADAGVNSVCNTGDASTFGTCVSCQPLTACTGGQTCGTQSDGCGGVINCGSCPFPQTCLGQPSVCCVPRTACPSPDNCGIIPDGCGGNITCGGPCPTGQICGTTPPNVCCKPATSCPNGQICGTAPDGCGGVIQCGACPFRQTCSIPDGATGGSCVMLPPPPPPCDPTNPAATTTTCLNSVSAACLACVQANGCLDPNMGGGNCEQGMLPTQNANLLPGTLPDFTTCAADVAPATIPVTERAICLEVMSTVFASKCGADTQLTPCLCGVTDTGQCLVFGAVPTGAVYDLYACDFNSTSGSTINAIEANFVVPTFGAGAANNALSCAGAFGCHCLGD